MVTALVVSGCGAVDRSSVGVGGRQPSLPSSHPAISADGRYVAFVSAAPDVVPGDTNGLEDVFVHDHRTGRTERVSVAGDGTQGDGRSWAPTLSPDGRYVGFMTTATTFYAVGSTREPTVALHDRATDATTLAYAAGPDRAVFGSPQFLDSGHLSVTSVFRAVGGVPARTTSEATCFHAGPS
ncbi:MAG TPA: hypothetical protein VF743_13410, partial [Acidimicrobiales bacterium]